MIHNGGINVIEFKNVGLVYPNGTEGLKNINVKINDGEFVVIVGLSGAGKSTFIRSINRLVTPTSGTLLVDNEDILQYRGKKLRELRTKIGMIFQNYNLVKRSNVLKKMYWQVALDIQEHYDLFLVCIKRKILHLHTKALNG